MAAATDAHVVPGRLQRGDGVPPDETPTAQYQDPHAPLLSQLPASCLSRGTHIPVLSDISVLTEIYDGRRLQASPKTGSR
jgi:hypothetical protein